MLHAAPALVAVLLLATTSPGCTPLTEELSGPTASPASPHGVGGFAPLTEPTMATIVAVPSAGRAPAKSNSIAARLEAGTHPLLAAVPGTEKVLVKMHATGSFVFRIPSRSTGQALWVMVRCSRPAPLTITLQDQTGAIKAVYNLASCMGSDAGGGTREAASTRGEVLVAPGIHVDLTLISSDLK